VITRKLTIDIKSTHLTGVIVNFISGVDNVFTRRVGASRTVAMSSVTKLFEDFLCTNIAGTIDRGLGRRKDGKYARDGHATMAMKKRTRGNIPQM
jgi:hypothetical protein